MFLGTKAVIESPQKPEEKRGEKRKASEVEDNGKKVWTVRWQPPRWEKRGISVVHFCLPWGKPSKFFHSSILDFLLI